MSKHLEHAIEVIKAQLGARDVRPQDRIIEDLGAESADIVGIIAALEDRYAIEIDEAELPDIRTVADLAASIVGHTEGG